MSERGEDETRLSPDGGAATVWIVDDSPLEASFASRALRKWNIEVFRDGSSMLERLATGSAPDVLLVDWQMPGISGVEICQYLRSNEATRSLPILLLTVQSETRDVVEGLRAGADDYVKKPYAPEELAARVESLARSVGLRRRAERAEAGVSLLLHHLPDALLQLDEHRTIVFANETAKRALDNEQRRVVGARLDDVLPELVAAVDGTLALAADVRIGARIYAPVVGTVPSAGTQQRTIALRDVTEDRGIAARRLDFYSIVAHDLRTPLAAALLRGENLTRRSTDVNERVRGEIEQMRVRLKEMAQLVDDFLDIARADATGIHIDWKRVDLESIVADAVDHIRNIAEASRITLKYEPRGPAPVLGDARRLRQVITNLLSNAIKFTPPSGCVTVAVEQKNNSCEVSVTDTGVGIAEEALPILFERYARAVDSRSVAGTGLGLMIVRELVEAHHGKVGVESRPGSGSRFWFTIPTAS